MSRVCPACGATGLPDRSRFCLACGLALSAVDEGEGQPPLPYTPDHLTREVFVSRSAREGERKDVTVLFADIAGSLAMSQALDPEDIHTIMDGFFTLALDAVHLHRGTINQFRGDGFMALFGAPKARGDDAARALRAALAIRAAAQRYGQTVQDRFGIPLLVRMGLNTGTVWVGSIGSNLRRDYTAEGPTVGLAARLEQEAATGQTLVSEETESQAHSFFEFRDLGRRNLKGVPSPVRVFELLDSGPFEQRFDAERAQGLTRFVGRESELAWLSQVTESSGTRGCRLVEVRGEAGVGKSRLVLEHVSRSRPAVRVLETRCRETGLSRAYAPWLEILRRWPADLSGAEGAARLAREFGGESTELSGTLERFVDGLAEILGKATEERPVILVVEDTHWLDPSSREVLRLLSLEPATGRVVLLTTARREFVPPSGEGPQVERLELQPLGSLESEALASTILGHLEDSGPLVALAVQRGGGNPLFIEEVARTLRDGAEEVREAARLEVELLGMRSRVPTTLSGVIAARIDTLPDPAKRLLQAVSVIGIPFDTEIVEHIEPEPGDDLDRLLKDLVQRGLLEEGPKSTFDFRHMLVREGAYSQLLLARRRVLHGRCAEVLAEGSLALTPDGASCIGAHFDRAGVPARATEYLTAAGNAYFKLYALSEAVAHLRRAWELHQKELPANPAAWAEVGATLVSALNTLDRAPEAARVLQALDREEFDGENRTRVAHASTEAGWVRFSEMSDVEGGRQLIERGLALVEGFREGRALEMRAHAYLARLFEQDAEIERAVASAERLEALATERGDRFLVAFGLGAKGGALCERGDLEAALFACSQAGSFAEESENELAIALANAWLAKTYVFLGEPKKALDLAERAQVAGERTRQVGAVYHAAVWSGHAYLLLGEGARAVQEFERLSTTNERWPATLDHRARGFLETGRFGDALEAAHECLRLGPPRLVRARSLCTYGTALGLAEPGGRAAAEKALFDAITLCERQGLRPHLAEAKEAVAKLSRLWGELEQARRYAKEASDLFEVCGMHLHAGRAASI